MMLIFYDGTFSGLLTSFFEVYERKIDTCRIFKEAEAQEMFFSESMTITSDVAKASRVWKGLEKKLSVGDLHNFYSCYLSEKKGIEDVMLGYVRMVFAAEKQVEGNFSNPVVLEISQVARKVFREKHRMEAFVRFKRTADGIFFADIEPSCNVLPLIASHFKDRYADQHWIIRDLKRKYAIYYDTQSGVVQEVIFDQIKTASHADDPLYDAEESLYQLLWKDYFRHVNIPVRKNTRLHLQHVPARYWKFLTEKQP